MSLPEDPRHPGKHIDPSTGIWPISEWGYECQRGFSSDARFGGTRIIQRSNRASTRKWREISERLASTHANPVTQINQDETEGS